MKRKTGKCIHCSLDISLSCITRHQNVCDGSGTIQIHIKQSPNYGDKFRCEACNRHFDKALGRSLHACKDPKRIERSNLSEYEYSKIYRHVCPKTDLVFWSRSKGTIFHPSAVFALRTYRARAAFKFNVYDYPELFNLTLIKNYGWYSPGGRNNRNKALNLNGVSRDHLYSVKDGWLNNIDANLLSHPANCQILLHKENIQKSHNSSITLEELKDKIKYFGTG